MRLAGQARAGFYPASPEVIARYVGCLKPSSGPFAILDPCAGTGDAIAQIAEALGAPAVHAIEVDAGRGNELVANLPHLQALAPADFMQTDIEFGAFSFCWLNPPFDDEIGGSRRVEYSFLVRATSLLVPGGIIALVMPSKQLLRNDQIKDHFMSRYKNVSLAPFPSEFRHYDECIVTAIKRAAPVSRDEIPLWTTFAVDLGQLPSYELPPSDGPKRFAKSGFTEAETLAALASSPLLRVTEPVPCGNVATPPLPLTNGHKAMMLTSGLLDGIVRPPGEEPHLVRGVATKTKYIAEETSDENAAGVVTTKTVFSERIDLTVRIAYQDGTLLTLTNGSNTNEDQQGDEEASA
jgi:predicted RNA methylase